MRTAIMGSGGLGGYLGGLLARSGNDVAFIARGAHLEALREHGLAVRSVHGDFDLPSVTASDEPAAIGPVDLVVFSVKSYDAERAVEGIGPLVGETTVLLPVQNGVEIPGRLRERYGDRVLPGVVWIIASVAAPGVIRQESSFRRIVLGELGGGASERAERLRRALADAGMDAELSADIEKVLWTKLVFFASFSGLASVARVPAGPLLASEGARELLVRAMREVEAVARARGVALDEGVVDEALAFALGLPADATSSTQRDVAAGRPSEFDALSGAVVRAGRATGVETPVHEMLWTCLAVADTLALARNPA